jgi:hypothetical protein
VRSLGQIIKTGICGFESLHGEVDEGSAQSLRLGFHFAKDRKPYVIETHDKRSAPPHVLAVFSTGIVDIEQSLKITDADHVGLLAMRLPEFCSMNIGLRFQSRRLKQHRTDYDRNPGRKQSTILPSAAEAARTSKTKYLPRDLATDRQTGFQKPIGLP